MGIMSVVGVGIFAAFAVSSDMLPAGWQSVFRGIALTALAVLGLTLLFFLRTGRYFGPLIESIHRRTGWRWAEGRTVHVISAIEDLFLKLARTDPRRIQLLIGLSVACYGLMALEVYLVFWAIGQPISLWVGIIVETFTRSASVAGGAIPGNLGALEASNVAVVKALGLAGGGTLALFRRVRSLMFAALGLALYPRDTVTAAACGRGPLMLAKVVAAITAWATGLGGLGLFIIAVLDSSFLSFPQVNDVLVIVLSAKYPERMLYYAGMTTAGSLVGCFMLFVVARRGGEVFMRKRLKGAHVDRALRLYQRFGLLAVVVPALLPPPVPFKLFVVLAGAAGVAPWRFALAIILGRGIRYFGQGYLAVLYGEHALDFMKEHGAEIGIGLAVLAVVAGTAFVMMRRRRRATA